MRSRLTLIAAGVSVFVALGCSLAGTAASWFPVRTPTPVAGGAANLATPTPLSPPTSTATPTLTPTEAPVLIPTAPARARFDSLTVVAGGHAALSAPGPAAGDRVRVEAMDTVIRLTWTQVPSATTYTIYRDDSETPLGQITATSYDDIGLTNGRTYSYTVAALDPAGHVLGRWQAVASPTGGAVSGDD